ncbi:hypothetical protein Q5762_28065 [Streptomyces sp. P9(2023)]|uniref:SCO6745 family protein n=1 Tax=Streptomyces sp. P9(2023) TaxID=3064394 RepID=UPI0028F40827|nr:hypothetical protein [Streptomyces sp. P9(2023)]MDT9692118.1 hypothetical protein [Streptomyces sp. P9(2023)]
MSVDTLDAVEPGRVRQMWHLIEPLHALVYYAPEAFDEARALGYDVSERWPAYFAWRAAPLGPAGAERVGSAFCSFSPEMVARYVPGIWRTAAPADVLAARLRAVDRTYRSVFGEGSYGGSGGSGAGERADGGSGGGVAGSGPAGVAGGVGGPVIAEAAALARRAAEAAVTAGRPLAAANAELPWPDAPHLVLWQAATILREHRGEGHLAALLAAGLDPVESLVSFAAVGAASEATFASRGWSEPDWAAASARLTARGLLAADGGGEVTDAGRALRAEVELRTDELAAAPWAALGPESTARLAELLGEPWLAALGSGLLPAENTLGIGKI